MRDHRIRSLIPAVTRTVAIALSITGATAGMTIKQAVTNPPHKMFQADGNIFAYLEPQPYEIIRTGRTVVIPQGFVTDFASVPLAAQSVLPQLGPHAMAAVLHDFLYWDQSCTREQADLLFYEAMTEYGVTNWRRSIAYWAVRLRGGGAWTTNAAERKAGAPRIIPDKYLTIPANARWDEYRAFLIKEGVKAEPFPTAQNAPAYCSLPPA